MADVKISQLPVLNSVSDSNELPIVSSGTTYQVTASTLKTYMSAGGGSTGDWTFTGNTASLPLSDAAVINTSEIPVLETLTPAEWGPQALVADSNSAAGLTAPVLRYAVATSLLPNTFIDTLLAIPLGSTLSWTTSGTDYIATVTANGTVENGADTFTELAITVTSSTPITGLFSISSNVVVTAADSVTSAFTFETDGTFVADSVLAGELYVSTNIITPMPTNDGYNTPQPVVVNGALTVLGNLALASQNIALGVSSGTINQGIGAVAIGNAAGKTTQGSSAVAIGTSAGYNNQGIYTVAIGAGTAIYNQGASSVAIGQGAAQQNQSSEAVAIGYGAASEGQGQYGVAIGYGAGSAAQATGGVAIGQQAGSNQQASGAVAIGQQSGAGGQGAAAVAIGQSAGQSNQGQFAVAIGPLAGYSNQAAQSIAINATSTTLSPAASGFYVTPVRAGGTSGSIPNGFFQMAYNPTTGEIIYWS